MKQIKAITAALLMLGALAGCTGTGWAPSWAPGWIAGGDTVPTGADLYQAYCAACHGAGGQGDGPSAPGLDPKPADLTGLARANDGAFPLLAVMSRIDGYVQGGAVQGSAAMPAFGRLLEGQEVLLETGEGPPVPTPERLVRLAEHLASLQAP